MFAVPSQRTGRVVRWILCGICLGLTGLWIVVVTDKASDLPRFERAMASHGIVPTGWIWLTSRTVVSVEIGLLCLSAVGTLFRRPQQLVLLANLAVLASFSVYLVGVLSVMPGARTCGCGRMLELMPMAAMHRNLVLIAVLVGGLALCSWTDVLRRKPALMQETPTPDRGCS